MHEGQKQIGLLGAIDTTTKAIRLDVISERNITALKNFVKNHIEPGINITYDGLAGYSFLFDDDSVWANETHLHRVGDFGYGLYSTSHIEQFWGI